MRREQEEQQEEENQRRTMDNWVDSEFEDSPRSDDGAGFFQSSPNAGHRKMMMAYGGNASSSAAAVVASSAGTGRSAHPAVAMAAAPSTAPRGGHHGAASSRAMAHENSFAQERSSPHSRHAGATSGHSLHHQQQMYLQQQRQQHQQHQQQQQHHSQHSQHFQKHPQRAVSQQDSQFPQLPQQQQQQQQHHSMARSAAPVLAPAPPIAVRNGGVAAKRLLIRRVQQNSMKMLAMTCQAVIVRGPTGAYYVYHVEITSDYYKQKWVVCKRYSEFYRIRKKLLTRLQAHKKRGCSGCAQVHHQLKDFEFPKRFDMFQDREQVVQKRTSGLEDFLIALCEYISGENEFEICGEINAIRFMVKEFLQFPLEHECQHVRAIRSLEYVDPRDVKVDTESCPICLSDWVELDGNQLVLSPCGHFFHEHCINEWYRTRFDCPMCRTIAGET